MALLPRADYHSVPLFHQTISEQACKVATGCTKWREHPFHSKENAWIVTIIPLFIDSETLGWTRQKQNADDLSKELIDMMNKGLVSMGRFVQIWRPGKLNTLNMHGTIKRRLQARSINNVPSLDSPAITAGRDKVKKFVFLELGAIHTFYFADISKSFKNDPHLSSGTFDQVQTRRESWRVWPR